MTRAYNTATTQQNSGGAVAGVTAGKNAVINGGFDIWQRGTSVAGAGGSGAYTADRWSAYNASYTVTRQATGDTTNLPFIDYCARVQRNSGATATNGVNFVNPLESTSSRPFIGKTVTLSFYARAGANYSSASNALLVFLLGGTGTDQNPNNTYTGSSNVISQTATLTTTWQRFSYTTSSTIATTVTELAVQLTSVGVGTAGANDYFEVTGVQLEVGSVATPFSRAGGTIQGETSACQRYYWRNTGAIYNPMGPMGYSTAATTANGYIILPVSMRVTPTSIDFANMTWRQINGNGYTVTALTVSATSTNKVVRVDVTCSGGGMTSNIWGLLETDGYNNGVFGLSAEL